MGEIDLLELRDINDTFYYSVCFDYMPSYYNHDSKNLLIFDTTDCDEITVESICNATVSRGAYEYLCNVLNTTKNTLVMWSQVEGTTSDYTIYYDIDTESIIDEVLVLEDILTSNIKYDDNCVGYKFKEVRNNRMSRIQF